MMELIVIACSKTKRSGGSTEYHPSPLVNYMSVTKFKKLMNARRELAAILGMPPGPDLGFDTNNANIVYSPAYQRYSGRMYSINNLNKTYANLVSKKIIIISGLYGILDASEDIRKYDLNISRELPSGQKVNRWWANCDLGGILEDIVTHDQVSFTHELLSYAYREALRPWPRESTGKIMGLYIPPKAPSENPRQNLESRANHLGKLISD